jgi:hypothetical protein
MRTASSDGGIAPSVLLGRVDVQKVAECFGESAGSANRT